MTQNENEHLQELKIQWCRWNGQRGTAKQTAKIKATAETLTRMLAARGITVLDMGIVHRTVKTEG